MTGDETSGASRDPASPAAPGEPSEETAGPAEQPESAQQAGTAEHSGTVEQGEQPAAPAADGLELARSLARAQAAAPGSPARRSSRRPGPEGRTDPAAVPRRRRSRASGARPDDRDPQLLGNTLDRLVTDRGWELDMRVHGVFGRWSELVGDEVAEHAHPEAFADGKLTVRTTTTAWATQLRLLAPSLVRRLNEELGHGTVVTIQVLGPQAPTWTRGRRAVRDGRGPRDTYG